MNVPPVELNPDTSSSSNVKSILPICPSEQPGQFTVKLISNKVPEDPAGIGCMAKPAMVSTFGLGSLQLNRIQPEGGTRVPSVQLTRSSISSGNDIVMVMASTGVVGLSIETETVTESVSHPLSFSTTRLSCAITPAAQKTAMLKMKVSLQSLE